MEYLKLIGSLVFIFACLVGCGYWFDCFERSENKNRPNLGIVGNTKRGTFAVFRYMGMILLAGVILYLLIHSISYVMAWFI